MYTKPDAPRGIGGVLDDGVKLYRDSFSRCWRIAVPLYVLFSIPLLWITARFGGFRSGADPQAVLAALRSPAVWLSYLLLLVVSAVLYNSLYVVLDAYARGAPLSTGTALKAGVRLLPRSIGLAILVILMFIGFGILVALAFALVGGGAAAAGGGDVLKAVLGLVVGLGALAVLLYPFGRIFLAHTILVVENAPATRSIGASWSLTRRNWWRAAVIWLVAIVMAVAVSMLGALVNAGLRWSAGAGIAALLIGQAVQIAFNVLMASFQPAILLSMYYDLKLRRDGADLVGRVNALAAQ